MPLPSSPWVKNYGDNYVGEAHEVRLFPAVIRPKEMVTAGHIIEEGQSSCYFHPSYPASAICEQSGRMICNLCTTEWNGQTVSFEALQELIAGGNQRGARAKARVKWDDVCLSLAVLPMLLWFVTLVTAPAVLVIALVQWRKGPTSLVRRSRWRYWVGSGIALLQVFGWLWFFYMMARGEI